jgi:hypothetical protein
VLAHADGIFTLIHCDEVPNTLQIRDIHGTWHMVDPLAGAYT